MHRRFHIISKPGRPVVAGAVELNDVVDFDHSSCWTTRSKLRIRASSNV